MSKLLVYIYLRIASLIGAISIFSSNTYKLLFIPGFENLRWWTGRAKVWDIFLKARKRVPAYKDFLNNNEFSKVRFSLFNPVLEEIPSIDKENYIKKYTVEEKCIDGIIPSQGVVVDESSGSSGLPNNWVRGYEERKELRKIIQFSFQNTIRNKQVFVINAFALGPWATGMNVSMSLVDISILKSTGPDIQKILNTLKLFGPNYKYVILGYPPFFKTFVDNSDIELRKYDITAIFGGEGLSEGMRDYLLNHFKSVYGSYGASDLEINIAVESDFTIEIRRLIYTNPEIYKELTKTEYGILPMVFQYSPLDYFIETNDTGELLISLCRLSGISPRIRYNIHDFGHVMRHDELKNKLQKFGIDIKKLKGYVTDLPLLFHYGRSDTSIAYYGCKITPGNISDIIFSNIKIANTINSFALLADEDTNINKRLTFALEIVNLKEIPDVEIKAEFLQYFLIKLSELNQDFRESIKMVRADLMPTMEFYKFGTGPFEKNDIRIKKHYIQKKI